MLRRHAFMRSRNIISHNMYNFDDDPDLYDCHDFDFDCDNAMDQCIVDVLFWATVARTAKIEITEGPGIIVSSMVNK